MYENMIEDVKIRHYETCFWIATFARMNNWFLKSNHEESFADIAINEFAHALVCLV